MHQHCPRIVSINISKGGIPKLSVESARINFSGLEGDGHNHAKHNDPIQAVCLQDVEQLAELKSKGYRLFPGATGENLTVRHLRVNSLPLGTILQFSGGVVLEISKVRKPCYVMDAIHPHLKTDAMGRHGMYAKVIKEGNLCVGETIQVVSGAMKEKIRTWIGEKNVVLVMASTEGTIVEEYADIIKKLNVKLIVVAAHRLGHPKWKPFASAMRKMVKEAGGTVIHERASFALYRIACLFMGKCLLPLVGYKEKNWEGLFEVSGRVCFQITEIAIREKAVQAGEDVIALAGPTALAFKVMQTSPPKLALMDIISRQEPKLLTNLLRTST